MLRLDYTYKRIFTLRSKDVETILYATYDSEEAKNITAWLELREDRVQR